MKMRRWKAFLLGISFCLLLLVMTLPLFAVPVYSDAAKAAQTKLTEANSLQKRKGFQKVAVNQYLTLFLDETTTEIAVLDREHNQFWFSNPADRAENEIIARDEAKKRLDSQLLVVYYTPDQTRKELDSYNDSVAYGQYEIKRIKNGVRIDYTLGRLWQDTDFLPVFIDGDRFRAIVDSIPNEQDRQLFFDNYQPLRLKKVGRDDERPEISEVNSGELLGDYVLTTAGEKLAAFEERELLAAFVDTIVQHRKDIDRRSELRASHIRKLIESLKRRTVMMLDPMISRWDMEDMVKLIKETGYTPRDMQADRTAHAIDPPAPNVEVFRVPVQYELDGRNLVATIPLDEIEYPADVLAADGHKATYPLYSVSLLDYFGAAGREEKGYMFVPDGSGALIDLNNDKLSTEPYQRQVYGTDYAIERNSDTPLFEQIYLPVFGMKRGDASFVSIIEEGAPLARIKADIAGRKNSYNTVSAEFSVMPRGQISLPSEHWTFRNAFQARKSAGEVSIRYGFLYGGKANYVGMAHYYQDYLVERDALTRQTSRGDMPFFLELIGGVGVKKPVLGAPFDVLVPLTSFAECESIVKALIAGGLDNVKLRYSGWLKGGLQPDFPYRVEMARQLGSKKEFAHLKDFLKSNHISLYPDVALLNAAKGKFNLRDASRFLDRQAARIYREELLEYDYQRGGQGVDYRYVVSPGRLDALSDRFMKGYAGYGFDQIALRDMGTQVNSDFNIRSVVDRGQAAQIIRNQLHKYRRAGLGLMVEGGNALALPYVKQIVNLPTASSRFAILDRAVPFYQIVVHGFIDYAGEPVNTSYDPRENFLKAVETGSSLYYKWIYRKSSILKDTQYNNLLSVDYTDWLASALAYYRKLNGVLRDVQGQRIIAHESLAENVYKTTFENGKAVIVNYNDTSVTTGGIQVGAKDFTVLKPGNRNKERVKK